MKKARSIGGGPKKVIAVADTQKNNCTSFVRKSSPRRFFPFQVCDFARRITNSEFAEARYRHRWSGR